jgi:ABC-type lipoprotein export system ATPase subunit
VAEIVVGRGLTRVYPSAAGDVVALHGVALVARDGELTAVAGPSGSGKSTLARLLGCVERPDAGAVLVGGEAMHVATARRRRALRRHQLSLLAPEPLANLLPALDAGGNLRAMARWRGVAVDVEAALAEVGLGGLAGAALADLSGGEQQRLGVAVAAVGRPVALVADEPSAELDVDSGALVIAALARLASMGTAVLVATHDPGVLAVASTIVHLDHGRMAS